MGFQSIISLFWGTFTENFIWYAAFAFPFFIIFWVVGKRRFKPIRIQEQARATNRHFLHDLAYSFSTFIVFGLLDLLLIYLDKQGYTLLYTNLGDYPWWWLPLSFFLALVIDDTFFYWSHRAMHHPRLYPVFHRVHHESTDPSPLTAFAFHPSEAVVEYLMSFILPFVLPMHLGVVIAWQIYSMLNNVLGHLGYEVYPKGWVKIPILKYKTASVHHNMHHQLFNGNYALYFTWWDKWMGTEFREYEARHAQIFERGNAEQAVSTQDHSTTTLLAESAVVATVEATIADKTYQFNVAPEETILQSALAQGVPLPYSCTRGRCGTCAMQCTAGQVRMPEKLALSDQERAAGQILTCQSRPVTALVKIASLH
jgi:sterol desaturase/sphingolipid hydroxylase (fatty acid hydroxylase superfamily)